MTFECQSTPPFSGTTTRRNTNRSGFRLLRDGSIQGQKPYQAGFYAKLCLNTPYVDFLKAHVDDMFAQLPAVDGLFFDIVQDQDCSCPACRREMIAKGIDPACDTERRRFGQGVTDRFKQAMSAHVRGHSRDCTILLQLRPCRTPPACNRRDLQPLGD